MDIQIAKYENMGPSGGALFNLIQNKNTPVLDLLVRESIQNSLDAADKSNRFVTVDYYCGFFDSNELSVHFDGIADSLRNRFPGKQKFLAVRDGYTKGLCGPLSIDSLKTGEPHGNLLKLVYEISNAQTEEGAGGSWGLGKTVFFRVGIGLVIYYSRIRTSSGYESRLAATLIEDETSMDALLPEPPKGPSRGIAWWGELNGEKTIAIRDKKIIRSIIDLFDINEYADDQTGTTVIIPYIDEKKLILDNILTDSDDGSVSIVPFFAKNIGRYLENSIYKWYAPRLDNDFFDKPYLKAFVNNKAILMENAEPFYKLIQMLYKRASGIGMLADPLDKDILVEDVNTRDGLERQSAGKVAYIKVSKKSLGEGYPENRRLPNELLGLEQGDSDKNRPIVTYTRSAGMIVAYNTSGLWTEKIPKTDANEFIVALFSVDSKVRFKDNGKKLDDYVRKSEMADHFSWTDYSVDGKRRKIISSIQNGVNRIISGHFKEIENEICETEKSRFANRLGEMLLPPLGFGHRPSGSGGSGGSGGYGGGSGDSSNGLSFSVDMSKIKYMADKMMFEVCVVSKRQRNSACIELFIDTENGCISADEWESELGLEMPFAVESVTLKSVCPAKKNVSPTNIDDFSCKICRTDKGCGYKILLTTKTPQSFKMEADVVLSIIDFRRDKKPLLALSGTQEENNVM